MSDPWVLVAVWGAAFAAALAATPVVRRLAFRFGFVDVPDARPKKLHRAPVPRLGGVVLYAAFVAGLGVALALRGRVVTAEDPLELVRVAGVLAGATVMFVMGVLDDRWEMGPWVQFGGQLVAAGLAVTADVVIWSVNTPLGGTWEFPVYVAVPFTIFWLMGAMNAMNWLDGLDGLATGVGGIAALIFALHSLNMGQYSVALLPLALAGALLGFLPYNFHPARIFMGGGAPLLGFLLGALSIMGGTKGATLLLVLGIPILDVAWLIVRRALQGRSPMRGAREHLHHRLLDAGLSQPAIVLLYYAFTVLLGALALLLTGPIYKLAAIVAGGLVLMGVFTWLARER
ncbi:MAG: undecaprenyl/decaprenyl-phosphate alpha-N-acetylglucosaminyl 1-phosphate transferase [Chloroflexi bacterium]|nr:undecaprenyl/decaprenyl-phosphate alpha-N-acetylglucosaminyl 1-phosphate transferase [Chloroflexota bacterium]MBU1751607.1 undecaprenyl/decaprenyl-phosphate alpha-N-acetylglucosaminyl 1-phosphate transferase [Chloroflexota bacterium]